MELSFQIAIGIVLGVIMLALLPFALGLILFLIYLGIIIGVLALGYALLDKHPDLFWTLTIIGSIILFIKSGLLKRVFNKIKDEKSIDENKLQQNKELNDYLNLEELDDETKKTMDSIREIKAEHRKNLNT